jgi:hypothetical protein
VLAAAVPTRLTKDVRARASAIVVPVAVKEPLDVRAGAELVLKVDKAVACSGGIPKPIKSVTNGI